METFDLSFVENFYKDEWVKVVQAQEVYDKVSYCKAPRIGRGIRLDRKVRMQIWDVFDEYQNIMNDKSAFMEYVRRSDKEKRR